MAPHPGRAAHQGKLGLWARRAGTRFLAEFLDEERATDCDPDAHGEAKKLPTPTTSSLATGKRSQNQGGQDNAQGELACLLHQFASVRASEYRLLAGKSILQSRGLTGFPGAEQRESRCRRWAVTLT
jgi:hypothetical protein